MMTFEETLLRTVAESSAHAYLGDVARFCRWFEAAEGEEADPATLTYFDVAAYRNALLESGRSAATINRALSAVQAWMRWAGNEDADQVRHVDGGRRTAPRALSRQEFRAVLRAAKRGRYPERNVAIVQMMAQAGLRIGEVVRLRTGDLLLNGRSGSCRVMGKRMKERRVPLNLAARKALVAWLEQRGADEGALFISQKGGGLSVGGIQDVMARLMRAANVDGSAHQLRHTYAREYLLATSDLVGLSRLLGHDRLTTTAIYTQPTEAELAAGVEQLAIAG